jgi:membrane protein required for colicin V production
MQQLSLTAVDYAALAVILISALYAMLRGLVHETFAVIDWVLAGYAAVRLTPIFAPLTGHFISGLWLQWVVAGVGVFLLVFIPLSIATARLARMVKKSPIGAADRVMGFVFGAGRGLVIVSFAYLAFAALVPEQDRPDVLVKARLYPVIRDTGLILRSLMPGAGKKERETAPSTAWVKLDHNGSRAMARLIAAG